MLRRSRPHHGTRRQHRACSELAEGFLDYVDRFSESRNPICSARNDRSIIDVDDREGPRSGRARVPLAPNQPWGKARLLAAGLAFIPDSEMEVTGGTTPVHFTRKLRGSNETLLMIASSVMDQILVEDLP